MPHGGTGQPYRERNGAETYFFEKGLVHGAVKSQTCQDIESLSSRPVKSYSCQKF